MPPEASAVRRPVGRVQVTKVRDGVASRGADQLAGEEPLEIRAAGPGQEPVQVAVTMRTPGNDFELAAGFLRTEGLVGDGDVEAVAYCEDMDAQHYNVVTVRTRTPFALAAERNFFATSSCGICGKAALEAIAVHCAPLSEGPSVSTEVILSLSAQMREEQQIFERTGGLHAAAAFSQGGELLGLREDVGRHNAVDKIVGMTMLTPPSQAVDVLMVSGRLSFEIVQKSAVAGIPVLCAVSAPSTLAVRAAEDFGMTLIGFLRGRDFNIYAHPERVAP